MSHLDDQREWDELRAPVPITFPNREQHPSVRVNDPDTCVEPTEFRMSTGRALALSALVAHAEGLTDFELAAATGKAQTSIGKRRGELAHAGLVIATTERRPSPSNSPAIVWKVTPQGVETWRYHA